MAFWLMNQKLQHRAAREVFTKSSAFRRKPRRHIKNIRFEKTLSSYLTALPLLSSSPYPGTFSFFFFLLDMLKLKLNSNRWWKRKQWHFPFLFYLRRNRFQMKQDNKHPLLSPSSRGGALFLFHKNLVLLKFPPSLPTLEPPSFFACQQLTPQRN